MDVRKIEAEDMPMLRQWAEQRGCVLIDQLLSPYGFLAVADGKPVLCAWAYMMLDVPIIQVDHVYADRRCGLKRGREAWDDILSAIRQWIVTLNERSGLTYCLIEIMANPVMEREIQRTGGEVSSRTYKRAHYLLN